MTGKAETMLTRVSRNPSPSDVAWAVAWVGVATMVAAGGLRLTGATSSTWEVAAISITPWLLAFAWPVGVTAVVRHRLPLATCCGLLALGQLVWAGPQFAPWSIAPAAASPARLRVFDANVSQANEDLRSISGEIAAADPQVVAIEELTPVGYASLDATGVLDHFQSRLLRPEVGAGGLGLWSTLPLTGATSWDNERGQVELSASVIFAERRLTLDVIHAYAPVGAGQPALWRRQLEAVSGRLHTQGRPLVVAGDFNATADLPQFRAITDQGLSDTAVMAGKGWLLTWPRNQAWVPPYLRLDHVLVSAGLTVTGYRLGTGRGSDHRPLVVDVAVSR